MSSFRIVLTFGCLAMALSVEARADSSPDDAASDSASLASESPRLPLRLEAGYRYKQLYGVPMQMGEAGLYLGIPPGDLGSVVTFVGLRQSLGKSEYGLFVWETSAVALFDWPLGRIHVGLEPHLAVLGVRRQSESGTMHHLDMGGSVVLGAEVIGGKDSSLQIVGRGGGDLLGSGYDGELAWGYSLSAACVF